MCLTRLCEKSIDVHVRLPALYPSDCPVSHTEAFRYAPLRTAHCADAPYFCHSQFATRRLRTLRRFVARASFVCTILNIIFRSANKKVRWVYAPRRVATMTNEHPFGNGSMRRDPHGTMSAHLHPVYTSASIGMRGRYVMHDPASRWRMRRLCVYFVNEVRCIAYSLIFVRTCSRAKVMMCRIITRYRYMAAAVLACEYDRIFGGSLRAFRNNPFSRQTPARPCTAGRKAVSNYILVIPAIANTRPCGVVPDRLSAPRHAQPTKSLMRQIPDFLHLSFSITGAPILACSLLLSACSSAPIVQTRTVTVQVPAYVPLDAAMTAPVPVPQPLPSMTNRDLLELAISRGDALRQANRQLDAIRELQPK